MKISIPFYTNKGEKKEDLILEVSENYSSLNDKLISQAARVEDNRFFIKPGAALTRGKVSGGGRKPFKQKGTGRARAGSSRSPIWRGGGITFGPQSAYKILEIPAKMRQKAILQLIASKAQEKDVIVMDSIQIETSKTKDAATVLKKINIPKKVVLVISLNEKENALPWRNIPISNIKLSSELLLRDMLQNSAIVFTKSSFDEVSNKIKI